MILIACGKIVAVMAELGLLMGMLKLLQRTGRAHPELIRKLLHVMMGLTVLSFPWLFSRVWPVVVLAGLATAVLLAARVLPSVRASMGNLINGVERTSLGEVYYPVAVGVLWVLTRGDPLLFGVPVLVLTLADATAALVGLRYGSVHYQTHDGRKSAEGSIAFFAVAMLSVHVPVLLGTDTGRAESLLLAVIVGLLVMLLESIAWRGLDNLMVPLGTYAFIHLYLTASTEALAWRCGVAVALVVFTLVWRRRSSMNDSALIAGSLFGYAALMLGGWLWIVPPAVLFVVHNLLWPRAHGDQPIHSIGAVLSITCTGMVCLLLNAHQPGIVWFWAYVASFSAHLAIIAVSYFLWEPESSMWRRAGWFSLAVGMGWILVIAPVGIGGILIGWKITQVWMIACVVLGVTLLAAVGFERAMPWLYHTANPAYRVHSTGAILGAMAAIITAAMVMTGLPNIR